VGGSVEKGVRFQGMTPKKSSSWNSPRDGARDRSPVSSPGAVEKIMVGGPKICIYDDRAETMKGGPFPQKIVQWLDQAGSIYWWTPH